ncbi:MAG TPA: hypothetical protein VGG89_06810 [Candidatus Baltobacteraceae bacterium]
MIVALLAALATATPSASPAPQEIFDRAFTRLASYPVAPYAVEIATRDENFTSPVLGRGGKAEFAERYTYRSVDGVENVTEYPVGSDRLPPALIALNQLGAFAWSPRRENLMAPQGAGEPALPDIPKPLKTIAHVVAYGPPSYAFAAAGSTGSAAAVSMETVDGHLCYHLRLRPLSDPQRHNLRDLWIDTTTFDLWKATFDGSYRPVPLAPSSPSTFTSIFAPIGQYWIVSRQHWTWTDAADEVFDDINMEVNKIVFPSALPDYLFDQAEYEKQQRADITDPLDAILNGQ